MARRIIQHPFRRRVVPSSSAKRAEDILKLIRARKAEAEKLNIWKVYPAEPEPAGPTADDWQKFKRDFVEEYGGEQVKPTGMTHSEFFDYFKNGTRECDRKSRLAKLLEDIRKKN